MKRFAILVALTATSCQTPPEPEPARVPTPTAKVEVDTWGRSLQCADHADRLANRLQRENLKAPDSFQVIDWNNHYNQKDERCYVEIRYSHARAKTARDRGWPVFSQELYDPVEGLLLASHTSQPLDEIAQGIFCFVPDPNNARSTADAECSAARKFILERMTN